MFDKIIKQSTNEFDVELLKVHKEIINELIKNNLISKSGIIKINIDEKEIKIEGITYY